MTADPAPSSPAPSVAPVAAPRPGWWRKSWRWMLPSAVGVLLAAYLAAAWSIDVIDANPDFGPGTVTARQSRAVAVTAALILREIDHHRWTANDPFFEPGWILDDMPHYQQGIIAALARFVAGLAQRQGGVPAGLDGDPRFAAGLLKYPGTIWKFASSTSWMPTASAEKQYRRAAVTLKAYNARVEQGQLTFDRSPQALAATLADVADDLGQSSAAIEADMAAGRWAFNRRSEELFYTTKGRAYAYSLVLRELGWDFARTVKDRDLGPAWRHMLGTLSVAAGLDPWLVVNGRPGDALLPSHLAEEGFYLLRARDELEGIVARVNAAG